MHSIENKQIVLLYALGRSGSNLLQSLIDDHDEVLMIPTIIWYYYDWEFKLKKYRKNPEKFINQFFTKSSFLIDWYTSGLGVNKDKKFDLKKDEIKDELLGAVKDKKYITRKDFILLLHLAYSKIFDIDISRKKIILLHHHFPINGFGYNYFNDNLSTNFNGVDLFENLLEDFPHIKISGLCT